MFLKIQVSQTFGVFLIEGVRNLFDPLPKATSPNLTHSFNDEFFHSSTKLVWSFKRRQRRLFTKNCITKRLKISQSLVKRTFPNSHKNCFTLKLTRSGEEKMLVTLSDFLLVTELLWGLEHWVNKCTYLLKFLFSLNMDYKDTSLQEKNRQLVGNF